ncbi:PREDICTED: light-inducible protein CPRF2 [Populus euphratica]|uniref:Light-inducible protein CPRF2 n=1 Tax=Populus euphratica TaxID=75702 RepID=A0AAJ6V7C2_POPEU|nr:PREDICTED: light-inducible protein CPRF2 [Populus euphratica]
MNSVFSVDDFSDSFWPSPPLSPQSTAPAMNRSESEWALEKFLLEASAVSVSSDTNIAAQSALSQSTTSSIPPENGEDEVVEITKHPNPHPQRLGRNPTNLIDSDRALLKSKLYRACTAVAMSRESDAIKPEDFSSLLEDQRLAAGNVSLGTQAFRTGHGISMAQIGADGGSPGIPALPTAQKKQEVQTRQTTSGSSREDSDDDDLEGDTGTNENRDPTDAKRVRRMQSNRESARRSRRRKQAQLNERETQVGQLRDERSSLLSRFTDVNQKCDAASVDNRILKADIETLRAKVKMVEEQVKRVTGLNPMLLAGFNVPSPGMPFVGGQVDASTNVSVPMQPNPHQFFHQPVHGITPAAPHLQRLNNSYPDNLVPLATNPQTDNGTSNNGGMASMKLTAGGRSLGAMPSTQQVQKQVGATGGPAGAVPMRDPGLPHVFGKDGQKK